MRAGRRSREVGARSAHSRRQLSPTSVHAKGAGTACMPRTWLRWRDARRGVTCASLDPAGKTIASLAACCASVKRLSVEARAASRPASP